MKCGILIIGSLYWDKENGRDDWRKRRLDTNASIPVRVPIYYGRKSASRGNTYTMTFRRNDPSGMAALVPCQREIETIEDLTDRSEERRVGTECVSTCRSRWAPPPSKNKPYNTTHTHTITHQNTPTT